MSGLLGGLPKPISFGTASRLYLFNSLRRFGLPNKTLLGLAERGVVELIFPKITPQEGEVISENKIKITKYDKNSKDKEKKHAIVYLHGGAFIYHTPTMYSYFADHINKTFELPVCLSSIHMNHVLTVL